MPCNWVNMDAAAASVRKTVGERTGASLRLLVVVLLASCGQPAAEPDLPYRVGPADEPVPTYGVAPHPLYNAARLHQSFQPLMDHLNRRLVGGRVELLGSRDYQAFERKYRAREPAFLLPNPWQAVEAIGVGYHVLAMWGDADDFKGLFIVRRDSDVRQPRDLRGKVVSYPSRTALAAAVMPQYFLHSRGINVREDIVNRYVGSQESSIMNVYLGQSVAGATWPPPWRVFQKEHPTEAAQLKVIWETRPLINNAVMVRDDVPAGVAQAVRQALLDLPSTAEGRQILAGLETTRFHPASDTSYDVVQPFVKRFEGAVRRVDEP